MEYKEKNKTIWEERENEIEKISKSNSKYPIDKDIKTLVIALKSFDFPTESSCIGHIDGEEISFPSIGFSITPPKETLSKDNAIEYKEHRNKYLSAQEKLSKLLGEFYTQRDIPFELKLSIGIYKNNKWGAFYLESYGAHGAVEQSLSVKEKKEKLPLYQKEMIDFGEFLKKKFLE